MNNIHNVKKMAGLVRCHTSMPHLSNFYFNKTSVSILVLYMLVGYFYSGLEVWAFTIIMVIIHGSQGWLLHAVCVHWAGVTGRAWPTHCLLSYLHVSVFVSACLLQAFSTNITQARCPSISKPSFRSLYSFCLFLYGRAERDARAL